MTYEPIYEESLDLITIEQLPIVAERFSQMLEPVKSRVDEILAMECTEETKGEVKKARSELNKFNESLRRAAAAKKKELFEPWNRVEEEIGRITKICAKADGELKQKIAVIEDEQKRIKELEIRDYFAEKCAVLGIEWLEFERLGLKIKLSDSLTALRKTVDGFTEKIYSDVTAILSMPDNAEIMAEYKLYLNLGNAVKIVTERRERTAAEAERMEHLREEKQRRDERAQTIAEAAQNVEPAAKVLAPPKEEKQPDAAVEADSKVYTMNFRVSGTLAQLKALKRYIIDNNITIIE